MDITDTEKYYGGKRNTSGTWKFKITLPLPTNNK